ncbi:MAG: HlyD family efflux transporter periplasmic adaptor subunit [Chloroflexi bacterium]|nr:MAG: HlyD family efflux transporter periplasmic adaptor subunit [Chloroflexota bacterium]
MSHNRPPVPVIIALLLAILGAAAYFLWPTLFPASANGALTASGTVESTEIAIAPELSSKVVEVLVNEGDNVKAGDVLFRLDDTLLKAQRQQSTAALETVKGNAVAAAAAVSTAQAQYDIVYNAALAQDKKTRLADWFKPSPDQFDQPWWYFSKDQQIAAAQAEIDTAAKEFAAAQEKLNKIEGKASSEDFLATEKALLEARVTFEVAKQIVDLTGGPSVDAASVELPKGLPYRAQIRIRKLYEENTHDLHDSAQALYDDAESALEDAQEAYDEVLTTDEAADVFEARADVTVAQERYYVAQDYLRALQTGSESLQVIAAQKTLEQAKAAANQAQLAVSQAEANLALIDAQISKLTVTAPLDGVVLSRNVEPGEVVNPGSIVLTLAKLTDLTLTVYVPEDRYGEISLGQAVDVTVDSFPAEVFKATVTHISDQAEFTPRNVQTVEGRKTTVFAIKLRLEDPEGKLKPGMPADVTFK